jgi:hypothetical protein
MKVTVNLSRLLHLTFLLVSTFLGGSYLAREWGMSALSAYAVSCVIVCQCSNIIIRFTASKGDAGVVTKVETRNKRKKQS